MTIGISGAGGHVGRRVVELLAASTDPGLLVALTRDPAKLADVAARGVTVRRADFDRPEELPAAFDGVDRLLLISTDDLRPGVRERQHAAAIDAAVKAGVRHVAYTSFTRPDPANPVGVAATHAATEAHLRTSGLAWTALRNNLYADMLPFQLGRAVATGALSVPAAEGAAAYVTREDCARAAAAVLLGDGHENRAYDVTGPEAVTQARLAELLTEVTGRPVAYQPVDEDAFVAATAKAMNVPPQVASGFASFYAGIRDGWFGEASTDVRDLTGRDPIPVRQVLQEGREILLDPPAPPRRG